MATTLTNPFGRPSSNRNKATSPAPQWTPSKKHMTAGLVTFVTVFLISTAAALTWNSQGTRGIFMRSGNGMTHRPYSTTPKVIEPAHSDTQERVPGGHGHGPAVEVGKEHGIPFTNSEAKETSGQAIGLGWSDLGQKVVEGIKDKYQSSNGEGGQRVTNEVKERGAHMSNEIGNSYEDLRDKTFESSEEVKNNMHGQYEDGMKRGQDFVENVNERYNAAKEKGNEVGDGVFDSVKGRFEGAKDTSREVMESVNDKYEFAEDMGTKYGHEIGRYGNEGYQRAHERSDETVGLVKSEYDYVKGKGLEAGQDIRDFMEDSYKKVDEMSTEYGREAVDEKGDQHKVGNWWDNMKEKSQIQGTHVVETGHDRVQELNDQYQHGKEKVQEVGRRTVEGLSNTYQGAIENGKERGNKVAMVVHDAYEGAKGEATEVGHEVVDGMRSTLRESKAKGTEYGHIIGEKMKEMYKDTEDKAMEVGHKVIEKLKDTIHATEDRGTEYGSRAREQMMDTYEEAKEKGLKVSQGLVGGLHNGYLETKERGKGFSQKIVGGLNKGYEDTKEIGREYGDRIGNNMVETYEGAKERGVEVGRGILDGLTSRFQGAVEKDIEAGHKIEETMKSKYEDAMEKSTGIGLQAAGELVSKYHDTKQSGKEVIRGMKDRLEGTKETGKEVGDRIGNQMRETFEDGKAKGIEVGHEVVEGTENNLRGAKERVFSVFQSHTYGSPRATFEGAGQEVAEGFRDKGKDISDRVGGNFRQTYKGAKDRAGQVGNQVVESYDGPSPSWTDLGNKVIDGLKEKFDDNREKAKDVDLGDTVQYRENIDETRENANHEAPIRFLENYEPTRGKRLDFDETDNKERELVHDPPVRFLETHGFTGIDFGHRVVDTLENVKDKAAETTHKVVDTVKETFGNVKDTARATGTQGSQDLLGEVTKSYEVARNKGLEGKEKMLDTVEDTYEGAVEEVEAINHEVETFMALEENVMEIRRASKEVEEGLRDFLNKVNPGDSEDTRAVEALLMWDDAEFNSTSNIEEAPKDPAAVIDLGPVIVSDSDWTPETSSKPEAGYHGDADQTEEYIEEIPWSEAEGKDVIDLSQGNKTFQNWEAAEGRGTEMEQDEGSDDDKL